MKSCLFLLPFLAASLAMGSPLAAQGTQSQHAQPAAAAAAAAKNGTLVKVAEKDATWAAQARKDYPLDVCLISDEKLGSMGKAPEYIYRVDGQPDRLVVFCCSGCEEDFMEEPAKYLAKIDAARAGKTKEGAGAKDAGKVRH